MKKQPRRSSFITRVQNSQFRRLFFKNWLLVILCVILPLLVCSLISQYVSRKNLMQELDTSSQRSVRTQRRHCKACWMRRWTRWKFSPEI